MDLVKLVMFALAVGASALPALATVPEGPYFDASSGAIFLPLQGAPSDVSVSRIRTTVTIDLGGVDSLYSEMSGQIDHSPLVLGFLARFNRTSRRLHLAVNGTVALDAAVEALEGGKGLLIRLSPRHGGAFDPLDEPISQRITLVPRNGGPIQTFAPDIVAQWADEAPQSPTGPPNAPSSQWTSMLPFLPAISLSYGSLFEQYVPEDLSATVPGVASLQVAGSPEFAGYTFTFRLGRRGYAFEDPDYPEVLHSHVDTSLSAAFAWPYNLVGIPLASGFGYQGLLTQVTSTTAPPKPPAPSRFFFASQQAQHGPFLYQRIDSPAWGPLSAGVELNWAPVLWMSAADTAVIPSLSAWRIEPSLRFWPGVSLGYFWEGVTGTVFNRQSNGFRIGVSVCGF